MADDRNEPIKPSWRRAAKPKARLEKSSHEWSKTRLRPVGREKRSRAWAFKAAAAAGLFVGMIGLVVWLIVMLSPPASVAIVLVGADYAANLAVPHNAAGMKGLDGLDKLLRTPRRMSWFRGAALKAVGSPSTRRIEIKADWDDLIKELSKKNAFPQPTLIIVVAMHGGSDPNGGYLLPQQATGSDDRLPLAHVIKSMGDLPKEKTKILVLEGASIGGDWRLGMLSNMFARRLKELEPEIRVTPNLWVLSANDVDQRSWASEGLGRSVFTHYLIEALRGKTSASGQRPSLEDVHNYVRRKVSDWAWSARGAVQQPVLLPSPEKGGDSQRPAAKKVLLATVPSTQPPQQAPAFARDRPSAAWKRFNNLEELMPHPAVYAPRRWREYRARLVRYEELARAGADDQVLSDMSDRIVELESRLRTARFLKTFSNSIENTLTMNALRGGVVDSLTAASQEFAPFWSAQDAPEAGKQWKLLEAQSNPRGDQARRALRSRVDDYLTQMAATDPSHNLKIAGDRLEGIRGTDYPQPAEAHFVRMLGNSFSLPNDRRASPAYWKAAGLALKTRRQAERAALGLGEDVPGYPYPEQTHTWVRASIETADELRRLAEDRLFSSEDSAWNQAEKGLDAARDVYGKAQAQAAAVSAALAARNRALVILPDYSRWLADRQSNTYEIELPDAVEKLWETTHKLTESLENPQDLADAKLESFTKTLIQGLDGLVKAFGKQMSEIESNRTKEDWVAYTSSAAVGFRDTDDLGLRSAIWNRLDVIRDNDFAVFEKEDSAKPSDDERKEATQRSYHRARLRGRMALAALGSNWFNDATVFPDPAQGDFQTNADRVKHAFPLDRDDTEAWCKDIAKVGEAIGGRWRQISAEVDKLVNEKNGVPEDLPLFLKNLTRADRLNRLLDGGARALVETEIEPASRKRQVTVHNVLLWMADRAWRDHWYAEEDKLRPPYYQVVGGRFVKDAGEIFRETAETKAAQERLDRPGDYQVKGPQTLVVTSELSVPAAFQIARTGTLPPGIPVVRTLPDRLLQVEGVNNGFQTASQEGGGETIGLTLSRTPPKAGQAEPPLLKPRVDNSTLTVEGFFRGRTFSCKTDVRLHLLPEIVAIGPAPADPPLAGLAVRADDAVIRRFGMGTGAITIVLDCSGSMIDKLKPNGKKPRSLQEANAIPNTRFQQAKASLGRVLKQIPVGTTVSVWIFGQARLGVNLDVDLTQPEDNQPETSIKQFLKPAPWDPNQTDALIERMNREIWPLFATPLVQAIWQAKADLDKAGGLKTLLVLTDGMDSRFVVNRAFNPQKTTIPQFMQSYFNEAAITINMVFFQVPRKEQAQVEANFKVIENLKTPGRCFSVEKEAELVASLERSIKQKLVCEVLKLGTPVANTPLDVAAPGEIDPWWPGGLAAGLYTLRVRADQEYKQEIELAAGDRLIVRLVEGSKGGLAFERSLYSDDLPNAVRQDGGNWRLSILSDISDDDGGKGFRRLASLESLAVQSPRISQVRPRFAWFEITPKGAAGDLDFAVRWRQAGSYHSPTWLMDIPQWVPNPAGPGLARPLLKAWWIDSEFPSSSLTPIDVEKYATPEEIKPFVQRIAGDHSVSVESLRLEDHLVEHSPGEPLVLEHCLVIRVGYEKDDEPVLITPQSLRMGGIEVVGYEHRYYTKARKYAGFFWPVSRGQFAKLKAMNLVSLPKLHAAAKAQSHQIEINDPPRPKVRGRLPAAPDAIPPGG